MFGNGFIILLVNLTLSIPVCMCRKVVFNRYGARKQVVVKLVSYMFISVVGKPHYKELLFTSVSKGRLQVVCPIICISQSQADI